ncbi:MAG: hypothetical protein K2N25_08080 [Muribaculaceae bacterium]|nr:hypothetical protein [Muribaculaceae bacterium]
MGATGIIVIPETLTIPIPTGTIATTIGIPTPALPAIRGATIQTVPAAMDPLGQVASEAVIEVQAVAAVAVAVADNNINIRST